MTSNNTYSNTKLDRKIVERNRRIQMKGLCSQLASLVPSHYFKTSKATLAQRDQVDIATTYIMHLKERIEELKKKKQRLTMDNEQGGLDPSDSMRIGLQLPMLEIRDYGFGLEVNLISGLRKNFMLYEVINVLEEEGASVVSASLSTVGNKVFHTLHAQVKTVRVGIVTSRVCKRLQELVSRMQF
ncbi:Myc-type, basic helix-loop-helix (bHLH) domain [Dillenia turbinata]|uniref:Myc-type, basic helix-loop-helix (BHLH) domain n=1 Tax=Dillenia turbinata TaxID=194707 RepID=A0AAN8V7D4_9MAGN